MADELTEALFQWGEFTGKSGEEFKLPNISTPWLSMVFELRNDVLDWAEVPAAHFDTLEALEFPPPKSADPDSKVDKKEVSLTQFADNSPLQPHFETLLEQQGEFYIPDPVEKVSSSESSLDTTRGLFSWRAPFPEDRSSLDEAFARTDGENLCSVCNAVPGHPGGCEEDLNGEGYGENEIEN